MPGDFIDGDIRGCASSSCFRGSCLQLARRRLFSPSSISSQSVSYAHIKLHPPAGAAGVGDATEDENPLLRLPECVAGALRLRGAGCRPMRSAAR